MTKNKTLYGVFFFIVACLFIALGIIILPDVTSVGNTILYYVLAFCIITYMIFYLGRLVTKIKGTRQVLVITELVIDGLIALSLILSKVVTFISIKEGFKVIGITLWLHCFFSIARGYYITRIDEKKYPVYLLVIDIFLLTFGAWLFFNPPFTNNDLIIFVSIMCFIAALIITILGILIITGKYNLKKVTKN